MSATDPAHALAQAIARRAGLDAQIALDPPPAGSAEARWAASGLAELTGPGDAAPITPERDLAGRLEALVRVVRGFAGLIGEAPALDLGVFSERAPDLALSRRGGISANGSARMLRCADGWAVANLARPEDLELFEAWIGAAAGQDPWAALQTAAIGLPAAELASRARLLGVAAVEVAAACDEQWLARSDARDGVPLISRWSAPAAPRRAAGLRVVDLSGLWAGPLCGRLFADVGAHVIKVESLQRPDGARAGAPALFDRMNAGKEQRAIDFATEDGRRALRRLIAEADVAIEASRPRALAQLGIEVCEIARDRPQLVWISLTAYGRTGPWSNAVGFGDDCAAAADLVVRGPSGEPMFVGDAIADPITGLMAAAAGFAALAAGGGALVDVSLRESAAFVAKAPLAGRRARAA